VLELRPRWRREIPGNGLGVRVFFAGGALYAYDGWGISYNSLRLRRFDVDSGEESASVRHSGAVRHVLSAQEGLFVLCDRGLALFDPVTLALRERWKKRLPVYGSRIVRMGRFVAILKQPRLVAFDPVRDERRHWDFDDDLSVCANGTTAFAATVGGDLFLIDVEARKRRFIGRVPNVDTVVAIDDGFVAFVASLRRARVVDDEGRTYQGSALADVELHRFGADGRALGSFALGASHRILKAWHDPVARRLYAIEFEKANGRIRFAIRVLCLERFAWIATVPIPPGYLPGEIDPANDIVAVGRPLREPRTELLVAEIGTRRLTTAYEPGIVGT